MSRLSNTCPSGTRWSAADADDVTRRLRWCGKNLSAPAYGWRVLVPMIVD
jgi:hypothetical protein